MAEPKLLVCEDCGERTPTGPDDIVGLAPEGYWLCENCYEQRLYN